MPRTHSQYNQDLPFSDGYLWVPPSTFHTSTGAATLTLAAKGNLAQVVAASTTVGFFAELRQMLRTGVPFITQEQFGTSTGPFPGPANSSDPDASIAGYPGSGSGFGNASAAQLTPRTGNIAKGSKILDVTFVESISGAALTAHTCGLSKTIFPTPGTPAALAISDIVPVGTNGLPTATNANPQSTKVSVASPSFISSDMSALILALNVTTQAGGAYSLFGAIVHLAFNFN